MVRKTVEPGSNPGRNREPAGLPRAFFNIPHLALVILWFGIDETAKIFLVALGVFFPGNARPGDDA